MILVGQYDSPFVRRVAVSLRTLGFAYEHDMRSVFGDFDAMRQINPLGRIPSLLLDDGDLFTCTIQPLSQRQPANPRTDNQDAPRHGLCRPKRS